MRCRMLLLALVVLAGGAAPAAQAALLGDAAIAYSAECTVTVEGKSYAGMVFHTPGHQRHEQAVQGIPEILLLDAAAKQGILIVPGLKSYIPFAFPKVMAELDDPSLRRTPVGQEVVGGVGTTKYRVDHTTADGARAQGFVWVSAEGVVMRLDGTVTRPGGSRPTAIVMALANLAVGPQDPKLFELPAGLVKLPAAALGGLLGGRSG
jgi:hypothetical protein